MQCDFRKRQKMVKSIKNQTLPAKKKQREEDAGICERENSFLFLLTALKVYMKNKEQRCVLTVGIGKSGFG